MKTLADILTAVVALLHGFFLVFEMFLWQTPFGQKVFGITPEFAEQTAHLAQNQGLYNGILAAGLIWTFNIADFNFQKSARTFFLASIVIAGIFGSLTAKPLILFVQAVPAFIALIAVRLTTVGSSHRI